METTFFFYWYCFDFILSLFIVSVGKDAVSVLSLPLFVFEPTTFIQLLAEPMQFMGSIEKVGSKFAKFDSQPVNKRSR